MKYIIEYKDNEKQWHAMMPEENRTDFGIVYTSYIHECNPHLERMIDMVYEHRAAFSNWEASLFINGQEVLYMDIHEGRKSIRLRDGSFIKIPPPNVYLHPDNILVPESNDKETS